MADYRYGAGMPSIRTRNTKLLAIALSAVVAFAVVASVAVFLLVRGDSADAGLPPAASLAAHPTTRVVGYLGVTRGQFTWSSTDGSCWGTGARKDVKVGAPVLISNQSGQIVAKGALGKGVAQRSESD